MGTESILALIYTLANVASVVVCLLAVFAVCVTRLFTKPVYRLSLYQVLASLLYSAQFTAQYFYFHGSSPNTTEADCTAFAFVNLYSGWMKLIFTACVTFHLFRIAVSYKDSKRLEPLYVALSLLGPAVIATVPLATGTYGSVRFCCWIQTFSENNTLRVDGLVETLALWYGPSLALLVFISLAALLMLFTYLRRAYFRHSLVRQQNSRAFKQLLPLAAFPILFLVFSVPSLVHYAINVFNGMEAPWTRYFVAATIVGWSISGGVTLIVHIVLTGLCSKVGICPRRDTSCLCYKEDSYASINDDQSTPDSSMHSRAA